MADRSRSIPACRKLTPALGIPLFLAMLVVTLALVEILARVVGWEFTSEKRDLERMPIFYRQPNQPVGAAFFRRPGPDRWQGQVLRPMLEISNPGETAYADEPSVVIEYDAEGFRNPPDLKDWDVVVAGDSFTELGFLPYDDLFTTVAGRQLKLRVKNLGVSHTGTLTQTFYLRTYGKSPATRHAVVAFFEGNDLYNISIEEMRLRLARAGSYHPADEYKFRSERSAIRFLYQTISSWRSRRSRSAAQAKKEPCANAVFHGALGDIPVTLAYAPPGSSNLPPGDVEQLERALAGWGDTARELGLKPWLLYMPCKERVLHGHLGALAGTPPNLVGWEPTDLPQLVESLCARHGIELIDATALLRRVTATGVLTYNTVCDAHLNKKGSLCVAATLTAALRAPERGR